MMTQMTTREKATEGTGMFGWFKKKSNGENAKSVAVVERSAEPLAETAAVEVTSIEVDPIPQEKIAARAYEIWVQRGKLNGTGLQDWLEAEAQLRHELQTQAAEPLPKQPR
jgi:hypothetical protein